MTELCLHIDGSGSAHFVGETRRPTEEEIARLRYGYRADFRWCRRCEGTPRLDWRRVVAPFVDRPDVAARARLIPANGGSLVPISEVEAGELFAAQRQLDVERADAQAVERFFAEIASGARAAYRASLDMDVLSVDRGTPGEAGRDPRARVRITDPKTGAWAEFVLVNMFDTGFAVKQTGGVGGTPFAKRAWRYAREFSPIDTYIRM